jgi:hypothetical protein
VRSGGSPLEGRTQDARWLSFAERTTAGQVVLYLVPIELDAPPRALVTTTLDGCRAPLASPDGGLVAIAVGDAPEQAAGRLIIARTTEGRAEDGRAGR